MNRWLSAAAIALMLAIPAGCTPDDAASATTPRPIVLVGLDGYEWDVALPLIAAGALPNLEALMRRGVSGELRSLNPTLSPVIWTSIATGQGRRRHGITGFKIGDELVTSADRRVKAFWNVLTDYDRRVGVVGWWVTWPVEPVNGVMVAQVNVAVPGEGVAKGALLEGVKRQVHPPELEDEIVSVVGDLDGAMDAVTEAIFGAAWDPAIGEPAGRLHGDSLWSLRADELYRRVGLKLLSEQAPFDLFAIYFGGPDVLGHRFWRYMVPDSFDDRPGDVELAALGRHIPDYYVHTDRVIGELIEAAPADAVFVVVSDHGMVPARTDKTYTPDLPIRQLNSGGHINSPPAFFVAAGAGIRASGKVPAKRSDVEQLGSVLDVFPTLCVLLDIPVGADFEGSVMDEILEPAWLEAHPPQFVASHTPPGWADEQEGKRAERFDRDERLEQLRSLGYIQ